MVEINLRGKNTEAPPALKQYVEKKLGKIEKFVKQSPLVCQVTVSTQRVGYSVEVTLPLNGYLLRAEESNKDSFAAVDGAVLKLEKQIEKYKTRLLSKRDKGEAIPSSRQDVQIPEIVRVKRFAMKPMSPEEATMQMELLGHDFFVFQNQEVDSLSVVYRRKDGNYGLIEPEY